MTNSHSAIAPKRNKISGHSHLKRRHYILGGILGFIVLLLLAVHLYLASWALRYVNRVLNDIDGYQGSIASIDVDLYRGAYRIHDLKLYKKTGHIPTPFIAIAQIDLSLQWGALFHGRIVSDVELDQPVINFATNKSGTASQTGAEVDWNKPIRDLMPIDINIVTFKNGKLTYQDFSTSPQVNIYINHMQGELHNLRNVVDTTKALPSTLDIAGDSIGHGNLRIKGHMNILEPVPDVDLDAKLENANLAAISNFTNAYAAVDIKSGTLNVYSEVKVKNNHVSGYIKPLANNISIIDLRKPTNPVKLAWEVVVSTVVTLFTNLPKDQFATKIPLEGNLDNISTDSWAALGGIIRNAFISAFKKGVDGSVAY